MKKVFKENWVYFVPVLTMLVIILIAWAGITVYTNHTHFVERYSYSNGDVLDVNYSDNWCIDDVYYYTVWANNQQYIMSEISLRRVLKARSDTYGYPEIDTVRVWR